MTKSQTVRHAVTGLAGMMLAGCGAERPVATFTHDLGGATTLYAYAAEPSAETRGSERLANRVYGMDTRSPETVYVCVWRDSAPSRFGAKADAGPPLEVLMVCTLGTDAWSPPADMMQYAEQAMRRDQATVRLRWVRRSDRYVMTEFQVSIENMGAGQHFQSTSHADEIAALTFERSNFTFPKSPVDPMAFAITAAVPQRLNSGEKVGPRVARISLEGTAQPIPPWMNY